MFLGAAKPQSKERGSVSRSTVGTKDAWDLSKARFQAGLLRVPDPRSNNLAQPASYGDRFTFAANDSG